MGTGSQKGCSMVKGCTRLKKTVVRNQEWAVTFKLGSNTLKLLQKGAFGLETVERA